MNYCNIYRSFQLGCLLFLALASLSSHSAYADWVVDAKCVNRPNNILKGISGYATGGVNSNNSCFYTCPPGGFTPHPQAPAVCTHNATGLNITGWEFVWFEDCPSSGCHTYPSGQYASEITLQSQNQDVGCTTNCDEPTYTYVFIGDQNGWRYLGTAVD